MIRKYPSFSFRISPRFWSVNVLTAARSRSSLADLNKIEQLGCHNLILFKIRCSDLPFVKLSNLMTLSQIHTLFRAEWINVCK